MPFNKGGMIDDANPLPVTTSTGTSASPTMVQSVQPTYTLASNVPIGAGGNTTPVSGIRGGVYVFDAQFTGTGPLRLQSLGADGVTWRDVLTMSASGTYSGEVRIGANASLRLASATALTGVSAVLS